MTISQDVIYYSSRNAGWSSSVARRAHNPKVAGSNPAPATNKFKDLRLNCCKSFFFGFANLLLTRKVFVLLSCLLRLDLFQRKQGTDIKTYISRERKHSPKKIFELQFLLFKMREAVPLSKFMGPFWEILSGFRFFMLKISTIAGLPKIHC